MKKYIIFLPLLSISFGSQAMDVPRHGSSDFGVSKETPTAHPDQTKPVTSSSSGLVQAEPETPSTSGSSSLSSSTDSYFDLNLSDIDSDDDQALQDVAEKLRSLFYTPQERQQLIDAIETKIQRDNNEQ